LNDRSIDPPSRAIIRQVLETNDPWLARLVRAQVDEDRIETVESELPEGTGEDDSSRKRSKHWQISSVMARRIFGGTVRAHGSVANVV
jgi:hypothetical protein